MKKGQLLECCWAWFSRTRGIDQILTQPLSKLHVGRLSITIAIFNQYLAILRTHYHHEQ